MKKLKRFFSVIIVISVVMALFSVSPAQEAQRINLNKASVDELMQLEGIGEKLAQRIVEYRESQGPFEQIEDVAKVQGIGSKVLESNKDRIAVE
ncbi:MAG: helix-hairpin-helix domain-containing protein [Thermodesulfobacteriota bacterium]|nr:helix-hairpin-helix domain-containing protein [Thermodesulfobacteriota bacterium]